MDYFAHRNQLLINHLEEVGDQAADFRRCHFVPLSTRDLPDSSTTWERPKTSFRSEWRRATKTTKKEPHAHHGAAFALKHQVWPVAFAVNGHHAGLHDRSNVDRIRTAYLPKAEACLRKLAELHPEWSAPVIGEPLPQWLQKLPFDARRTAKVGSRRMCSRDSSLALWSMRTV